MESVAEFTLWSDQVKVLFVDDDPQILRGIKRMMFHVAGKWELLFAPNGQEALRQLETAEIDVLVTDMRMPDMDGTTLLTQTASRFPDVARIVLSGYAEFETLLRAISVSHQFLNKPCQAEVLHSVIQRAFDLQQLISDDAIREIVGRLERLPAVPRLYAKLTELMAQPETTVDEIAEIIKQDPAMAAKLLQLVNTAYFSPTKRVSNITLAVIRMGFRIVKNLVLSIEVFEACPIRDGANGFSIEAAQAHALRIAKGASALFDEKGVADDAFTAGLLHDIGKLLLAAELPERLDQADVMSREEDITPHEAEKQLFGITHAEIGAYLLSLWGLPYQVIEAVANHHEPWKVDLPPELSLLTATYMANELDKEIDAEPAHLNIYDQDITLARCRQIMTAVSAGG